MDSATQTQQQDAKAKEKAPERAYHKGNVAEDLRAAALRILTKEKVEDVTLRRLTREVGVTPANFYNHFANVEDLLLDIAADGFDDLSKASERAWKKQGGKADVLVALATEFVRFGCRKPQLLRLMFGHETHRKNQRFHDAANGSFAELVRFIYGEDRFDPNDSARSHEHCRIAYGFFAFCYGLARTVGSGQFDLDVQSAALDRFVEQTVRPFLDGSVIEALAQES